MYKHVSSLIKRLNLSVRARQKSVAVVNVVEDLPLKVTADNLCIKATGNFRLACGQWFEEVRLTIVTAALASRPGARHQYCDS